MITLFYYLYLFKLRLICLLYTSCIIGHSFFPFFFFLSCLESQPYISPNSIFCLVSPKTRHPSYNIIIFHTLSFCQSCPVPSLSQSFSVPSLSYFPYSIPPSHSSRFITYSVSVPSPSPPFSPTTHHCQYIPISSHPLNPLPVLRLSINSPFLPRPTLYHSQYFNFSITPLIPPPSHHYSSPFPVLLGSS